MKESIIAKWVDGMAFEADVMGHKIMIDADPEFGGKNRGPKPKPFMLVALAGCTGMDVVSLLHKMRVDFNTMNVLVEGELSDEHPKKYVKMLVVFQITGRNVDRSKVEKAVSLSAERYCGVTANYKSSVKVDYRIEINEE
jgi:putative redox protein